MSKPEFIEIQPFEYQCPKNNMPRLVTYYGFKLSPALTQEIVERIINNLKAKKKISVITNPNTMIVWQYEGKPSIALDKKENKVYTTQKTINHFGIEYCQKQAAYVLQILRKYGYAKFIQFVVKFEPYRLGRTPAERKLTFEALNRLAKKKPHYSHIKPNSPKLEGIQFHAEINYQRRRRYISE
jgi:hypothetical protein